MLIAPVKGKRDAVISGCAIASLLVVAIASANRRDGAPHQSEPTRYTYQVIRTYPHDIGAFTQGLVFWQGFLYEGTGLEGRSSIRKVELESGRVLQSSALDRRYFGEGIAILGNELFQLTWKSRMGFVYDLATFKVTRQIAYDSEGWGLTTDGSRLLMSDGTSTLRILDKTHFRELRRLTVRDRSMPVESLNELEYVDGEVFANVWQSDLIARISLETGRVTGWIDLTNLLDRRALSAPADVLNGIAYDSNSKRLWVTGKLWPRLFEIKILPAKD